MELTPNHKEALLSKLEELQESKSIKESLIEKTGENDPVVKDFFEMEHFLILKQIELIKGAIITNRIDY